MLGLARFARIAPFLPATALIFSLVSPAAQSQVIEDVQVPFSSTLNLTNPTGTAVAADGTVYVAAASKVYRIQPAASVSGASGGAASIGIQSSTALAPSGITLRSTSAVAVDAAGHLYIADATGHQVVEMTSPETSSAAQLISYKSGTEAPTALAVDAVGSLYIADASAHAIYKYSGGSSTQVPITGGLSPVGLAVDAAGNVYFADSASNSVYKFSAGVTSVFLSTSTTWPFLFGSAPQPVGMGFDPAGNFYLLLNNPGSRVHVIETSPSNPSTIWEVPTYFAGNGNGDTLGSAAVGPDGNVYLTDQSTGTLIKLFYNNNPVNFGTLAAGTDSSVVRANYNFISRTTALNPYQSMQGDHTGEFVQTANSCSTIANATVAAGTICSTTFLVNYQRATPGLRSGVFGFTGGLGGMMVVPTVGVSQGGSLATYPGAQVDVADSTSTRVLSEPQGLAVSGNGGTLFVADEGGCSPTCTMPDVWAYTDGQGTPMQVTGMASFPSPIGIAVDAAGNLVVADYSGTITKVAPPWNSPRLATRLSISGVTLDHPISVAIDPFGNIYIGDAGPSGVNASASSPGFIVKIPANGGPAVMLNYQVNGQPVIYPQALAFDQYGNLFIADASDGVTSMGSIDVVPAATGLAVTLPFTDNAQLSSPSGISIDAAGDLYVLDGFNERILVTPIIYGANHVPSINGGDINLLGNGNSGIQSVLITASNMVLWPGSQKLSVADIGNQPQTGQATPAQVITLDATTSTVDASSGSATLTGVDVGNLPINFGTPGKTGNGATDFTLTGCGSNGSSVAPGLDASCTTTINYSGPGNESATFRLDNSQDQSTGNTIFATAHPSGPWGVLTAATANGYSTITLTNIGLQQLNVSNISTSPIFGDITLLGNSTCLGAGLGQNQSCTEQIQLDTLFTIGTVTFTDNSLTQPQNVSYFCTFFTGCTANINNGKAAQAASTNATLGVVNTSTDRPGVVGSALGSFGRNSNALSILAPWEAGPATSQSTTKGETKNNNGSK